MKLLVINGPNLNLLGRREPEIYGTLSYTDLVRYIRAHCHENGISVSFFQSNSESALVSAVQDAYGTFDGIILNPGAYTHTSVALLDALKAVSIPAVEVHISDVDSRESFRQLSYVGKYCEKTVKGLGFRGYLEAVDYLQNQPDK